MSNFCYSFVAEAVRGLSETVGFRKNVRSPFISLDFINRESAFSCANSVARNMGLPVSVSINFSQTPGSRPATVKIPSSLPRFGSSELVNYPIDVTIYPGTPKSGDSFIAIIAHEMAHIVLHSLKHPDKESEEHTDICAMLLGYQKTIRSGRKKVEESSDYFSSTVTTTTTTYGYLNDTQFGTAYREIKKIWREYNSYCKRSLRCINQMSKLLKMYIDDSIELKKQIEYIAKKGKHIEPNDVTRIAYFCSIEFADIVASNISTAKSSLDNLQNDYKKQTDNEHKFMRHAITMLDKAESVKTQFGMKCSAMNANLAVINNYLPTLDRIKFILLKRKGHIFTPDLSNNASTIRNATVKKVRNHYDNLKVTQTAPPEVITAAYEVLAKQYHSDSNKGEDAERIFKIISRAYEVLSDENSRKEHDEWIARKEAESNFEGAKQENSSSGKAENEKVKRPSEYISPSGTRSKFRGITTWIMNVIYNILPDSTNLRVAIISFGLISTVIFFASNLNNDHKSTNNPPKAEAKVTSSPPAREEQQPVGNAPSVAVDPNKFKVTQPFNHPIELLPVTGKIFTYASGKGLAPLQIKVPNQSDHYYVKVVDKYSGTVLRSFFIRSGEAAKIKIPLGVCNIKYAYGTTWYGKKYLFGPDTHAYMAEKEFNFRQEEDGYAGFTIELIPQVNGNLHEKSISVDEF